MLIVSLRRRFPAPKYHVKMEKALIEKLNILKRDQEVRERLEESLQEFKSIHARGLNNTTKTQQSVTTKGKTVESTRKTRIRRDSQNASNKKQTVKTNEGTTKTKVQSNLNDSKNNNFTIIGYCFAGNPVPYSTKVRTNRITLGHFKTLVNRKGDFRYFFKRYCNEFGTNVVFEEITDNEELLPLWDGKIFALIEEIEEYRL